MTRDGAGRPGNRPIAPGVVPQLHAEPHTISLPVVDGKDLRFTRLSTDEGLSQTKVSQVVQDDQGFIWFGTQFGLNRYDGYNFKLFVHDPRNLNSLSGVYISALFKDRNGALWVGCDQFLNKFNREAETFTRYPVPSVTSITQDRAGILWLATARGMYSLDPATGTIRRYSHNPNDPSSLSSDFIKLASEDKEGRLWVAAGAYLDEFDRRTGKVTRQIPIVKAPMGFGFYEDRFGVFWIFHDSPNALSVFDRKTNTLTNYSLSDLESPNTAITVVMDMTEDRNGTVWLATHRAGLLKFDREHERFIRYRNKPDDPTSLPQNDVQNLFADREGSVWAGLGRMGVVHFATNPMAFKKIPQLVGPEGTAEPFVGAIYEDPQGILWIGTPDALNSIDRKTGTLTSYRRTASPAVTTDVIAIHEDRSGNLWAGTYGHGLLRLDQRTGQFHAYVHNPADPSSLSNDVVPRLLVDHSGTLWAATNDGLNRFDEATGHFTVFKLDSQKRIVSYLELVEDQKGALWLGTDSSGLQRFDPATGQFTKYEHDIDRPGTLSDNRVNSVHFDRSGTMWVGTQNGLDKFDSKTGTFTAYTRRDGLPANAVGCVLEDDHGNLWMSTSNGIARFDRQSASVRSYSVAEGLPGPDLSGWGACYKTRSGEMFFGGFNGATYFDPDRVVDASYTPSVVLTEFRLSGSPVEIGGGSPLSKSITDTTRLTLSHEQRIFSLAFSALSYFSPGTNRYRYKLEGLDPTWREVGSNERLATYTTLPVGEYTFRVQGATSRGNWSEPGAAVIIRILPAWWSTWWFRALCMAISLALLAGIYHRRIQQVSRQEKHLRDVVETIPAMAFSARPDGSTEFVNRPWLDFTGFSSKTDLDASWQLTLHSDDVQEHMTKWRASLATGAPFENEVRHRAANGEYRWFLVRAVPLRDKHGKVLKWYGTLTDIEDRKRAEQERERFRQLQAHLAHENRVSMMGELVASLSHELRQPITASIVDANACLLWLTRDQPNVEEALNATKRTMKDGTRAAEIIDRVRSFYRKGAPPERESVDVNEVVREMLALLRAEADGYSIPLRINLARELPRVTADRVQLQQVLMNLMLNGIEAMKETGGELTIRSELGQDGQLLISISDTGVGLPDEKMEEIFSPFFTTKPQGSGMGLAICRSIVEAHSGRLWARPNHGRGATFYFTLPAEVTTPSPSFA
ncbi:two-component regulator propeller domain-containing protein [Acidicapsa acidisoli]|uniref:two-component regulator propeller domain-containing protein n=1 Tax=Acidicapsa acidisoli TaxID=1615681 RepID=UPI0021DF48F2|nr:two-component regulator propeller domain-containing protein [Acidicapsa acidisoli]